MDIKDTNFVTIQGWMRTKLNLKGNELLAYAVIYGFSQTDGATFTGSRKYLAEWCGCSLATVDRTLNALIDKGLISRTAYITTHGYRAVEYSTTYPTTIDGRPEDEPRTKNTDEPHVLAHEPQPLPIDEPQTPAQPKTPDPTEEVIDHLNQRAGTRYKATTPNTRRLIKARLNEGFTIEDMKLVIDKKSAEWLNNRDMAQYLRPETLFGNKFESYLNARTNHQSNTRAQTFYHLNPAAAAAAIDDEGHVAECTRENGWF